jgi:hypothetical protein
MIEEHPAFGYRRDAFEYAADSADEDAAAGADSTM